MGEVYEAFLQEYEMQKCMGYVSEEIDGFTNFVFLTAGGSVLSAGSVNRAIANISEAYNSMEINASKMEIRIKIIMYCILLYKVVQLRKIREVVFIWQRQKQQM